MKQLDLFDEPPPGPDDFEPCDPSVTDTEKPRLSRQCLEILDRLGLGDATNKELSKISLKYTGRISDLRKAGHAIVCISRDYKTGLTWYRLATGNGD